MPEFYFIIILWWKKERNFIYIWDECPLLGLVLDFISRVALMCNLKSRLYTYAMFTSLSARHEQNRTLI